MSLLEDEFLEDEAGEAQELERVIEGEEYDERPLSPNSDDNEEKDDEAEEDKRRVDPSQAKAKRVVKNPRFILNPARLTGPRGIQVIPDHFKDFKFKGKGHEKDDLDMVLKKLEHWAYRLYPKFGFHDCLKKIEMLGKKRTVMVHLTKIRSDQLVSDEAVVQKDSSDDEAPAAPVQEDEFDKLLQQQIELARSTPAPGSVKKTVSTPSVDRSLMMPKATSSPSISDEQRERMLRNRRLAEERRLAKLKNNEKPLNEIHKENNLESEGTKDSDEVVPRKHNRSHVFDSSDDEESSVNRSISVDIHSSTGANIDNVRDNETLKQKSQVTSEIDGTKDKEIIEPKLHKSNVIDSSDEDEVNEVNVKLNNKHTEGSKGKTTEVPEYSVNTESNAVFARKRHRINAIDSSDDDETSVDQSIDGIEIRVNKEKNNEDVITSQII